VAAWLLPALLVVALAPQSEDLVRRSQAAVAAMQKGSFDEAARMYQELVRAVPGDAGLLMNLGMALAMGGREAEAIGPLERAIKLKPALVPAQLFLGSSYLALGEAGKAVPPLKRAVAAEPSNLEYRRLLARAYVETDRPLDAVGELRAITDLSPKLPAAWYALFHGYNDVAQEAIASFADLASERSERATVPERGEGAPARNGVGGLRDAKAPGQAWQDLLLADALLADGRFADAFGAYRETLVALPSMVTIRDSIASIYEQTGHRDWAAIEREKGRLSEAQCAKRRALCAFRAGRYRTALTAAGTSTDPESRYWRARAATELTKEALDRLDKLPDSRERREVRAAMATADRRHPDAVRELKAALQFAPKDVGLIGQLGTALYLSREYEPALEVLAPVVEQAPASEDVRVLTAYGDSLLQMDRVEDAVRYLRRAFTADTSDRAASLSLARAYIRQGDFRPALPLLEWQVAGDTDGSVHVLLSRALAGLGQTDKAEAMLAKSQEIQRAAQREAEEAGKRVITPPK
jgi:tetratricopeptide (TPR) repeat protein